MSNLSQEKRERMLNFLETIKKEKKDDEWLIAINEIENELNSKKYGLVWEKHEEAVDAMMRTHVPVFTEVKEKEIHTNLRDENYNFLLEGDNLHSLKLLEKTHKGKVDVIYIDPPYNTGKKDFRYEDRWIEEEDSFRHSMWLSFIYERLVIARRLLARDGIIFISIDDNEIASMRMICDEIFGENNRIATLVWKKRYQGAKEKHIVVCHEYILIYAQDISLIPTLYVPSDDEYANRYFKEEDEYGKYRTQPLEAGKSMDDRDNLVFPITAPDKTVINPKRQWIWSKEHVTEAIENHKIGFKKDKKGNWTVFIKQYLNDENGEQRKTKQFSIIDGIYTQHGTKEIEKIFGDLNAFKFPKPHQLIIKLLEIVSFKKDYLVLDFFAGSGTTGQAVLELNQKDKGNRRFILCTNNENNICEDVTYNRLKTVIYGKCKDGREYSNGIKENLKYYKTDFISKNGKDDFYSVEEELSKHIKEMIELERGISIDNDKYLLVLSDDEMDLLEKNPQKLKDCKAVYLSGEVFLTQKQEAMLNGIETIIIPKYYFEDELMEVGEL